MAFLLKIMHQLLKEMKKPKDEGKLEEALVDAFMEKIKENKQVKMHETKQNI